jgi:hypothetical protein
MKKSALVTLLVIGLLVSLAAPSEAWHHRRGGVFIGVGPVWWGPPFPYWYYPPPPYYVYPPPTVVIEQPQVYVEQHPAQPAPQAYWYYCPSSQTYYPQVQTCSEAWVKVPPRTP